MTKRSQTGGLPDADGDKTPAKSTPARYNRPLRERQSRAEREARTQRIVVLTTIIVASVIALLLAIALVIEFVVTPGQAVATVNGENITVTQFQQRVRLERSIINESLYGLIDEARPFGDQATQYLQLRLQQEPYATWYNEIQVGDVIGNRVLNEMINERLIAQQAAALGITVTDEDIQAEIDRYFEYVPMTEPTEAEATAEPATATPTPFVSPTPSPEPTATEVVVTEEATEAPATDAEPTATFVPTQTPVPTLNATERAEAYASDKEQSFANIASNAGVTREEVQAYFERKALRTKVAAEMTADTVSGMDSEVQVRHILVATQQEALDLLAALEAGESFTELARAVSLDTGSAANGGEYDWSPAAGFVGPFADAVRDAEIGEFYGPVQTEFGYHIVQVRGRRDVPMASAQLQTARDTAFATIVSELRTSPSNQIQTFPIWAEVVPSEPAFIPRL